MPAIAPATGPELSAAIRDATPLMGRMGKLTPGEPLRRVIAASVMLATFHAAKAGMTEEEFITYARQMFAIVKGSLSGTLAEVVERFRKEKG